jgi:large-conductance mechanosensitive channel
MATRPRKRKTTPQNQTTVVTAGTTVRIQPAKSSRRPKAKVSDVAVVVAQEINPVSGFVGFLREHAIVGLAVGFAIATQVQGVVKQLISSFIDPLYALLFSGDKLSARTLTLHWHGRTQQFGWGAFAYTLIDFLFVLGVIYAVIKIFKLDKLDKPKEEKK